MNDDGTHWSSPNGCHEDCPVCAAERETAVYEDLYIDLPTEGDSWKNVKTLRNARVADAVKYIRETLCLNCDDKGRVCLISQGQPIVEKADQGMFD